MGSSLDNSNKAPADGHTKPRAAATRHEQLEAEAISRNNCCEMGQWLHRASTSKFGASPAFVNIDQGDRAKAAQMPGSCIGFSQA